MKALFMEEYRFQTEIEAMEREAVAPLPERGVLFYGSSSIRLWSTLTADFPSCPVVNRGVGGANLDELIACVDRLVVPLRPSTVVIYGGDNDLDAGKSPERVFSDFMRLLRRIREALPNTRQLVVSIKPSPARQPLLSRICTVNTLLREFTKREAQIRFVDVFHEMMGPNGLLDSALYVDDGLHLNANGYAVWRKAIQPLLEHA